MEKTAAPPSLLRSSVSFSPQLDVRGEDASGVLAGLDSYLATDRASRLMEAAEEPQERGLLGNVVLGAFDPESVDALRDVALGCFRPEEIPDTGEINDLRLNLAPAAVLLDVPFPERDVWL